MKSISLITDEHTLARVLKRDGPFVVMFRIQHSFIAVYLFFTHFFKFVYAMFLSAYYELALLKIPLLVERPSSKCNDYVWCQVGAKLVMVITS